MPVLDGDFEAFVTNLGKYNEGMLVGEWVKFPTTEEEMQKVFERIGIGKQDEFGQPYEEWFITDYECPIYGVQKMLGEYESLDTLIHLYFTSTNYDFLNSTNWNLSLCKAGINPYNYFNLEVLTQLSVFCNFSILECQCKSAFSIFIKAKNVKLRKNQFRYSQFYLPQYLEKHCHVLPGAWSGQTPL